MCRKEPQPLITTYVEYGRNESIRNDGRNVPVTIVIKKPAAPPPPPPPKAKSK